METKVGRMDDEPEVRHLHEERFYPGYQHVPEQLCLLRLPPDIGSVEAYVTGPTDAKATLARAAGLGCIEALFTYGDAPSDARFARQLKEIGYGTLTAYVRDLSLHAISVACSPTRTAASCRRKTCGSWPTSTPARA